MKKFTGITSKIVPLIKNNIDTDQIIPARFLKVIDKSGLGQNLFSDWRYKKDGSSDPDFILNQPQYQGARILLVGDNFGCGSSREHAPWALVTYGFQVVISTSFADIFCNNALKNGLLPLVVDRPTHKLLCDLLAEIPITEFTVDLVNQILIYPQGSSHFPIDAFSKNCLIQGVDELGFILGFSGEITTYEKNIINGCLV